MGGANLSADVGVAPPRRRTLLLRLAAATAIGASGLAAGGTASGLLGAELAGSDAAAGVPLGTVVIGSAFGALLISRLEARLGRGPSLALGYLIGGAGAVVAVVSASIASFGVLLAGCALYGVANAAVFLTRYAAADISAESARGRALGLIFLATALGAIASPALLHPSGQFAETLGLPPLSGMFVVAAGVFATAAGLLAAASTVTSEDGLRPLRRASSFGVGRAAVIAGLGRRDARLAVAVLAVSNLLMVGVMAVAPVRMMEHGHGLTLIGVVISVHVAGMFCPSPFSGWLGDRVNPGAVALAGVVLLIVSGCYGALVSESDAASLTSVLVIVGVGWNFGVVGGSTMLIRAVPDQVRPHAEGIGEVGMGLAAAVAAPLAGVLVALAGLAAVWVAVALVGVLALAGPRLTERSLTGGS